MMSIIERKEEAKRRLAARKSQRAATDSSHIAKSQAPSNAPLAVVPMREPNLQVTLPNTDDVVQRISQQVANSLQTQSSPFSRLTYLNMVFGNDSNVESVLNKLFGDKQQ